MIRAFLIFSLVTTLKGELITLTVDPDNRNISTYSTGNGSAAVEITNTGTIEADITIDSITRKPTNITFIGGTLFYSDANSIYTPFTLPQTDNLILNFANVSGNLESVTPNSPIDPTDGLLINEDHTTSLTSGSLYTEYQVDIVGILFPIFSQTTNFATSPQVSSFFGTNTLTSAITTSGLFFDTLEITLTSVADPTSRDLGDLGVDLIVSGEGGFSAIGTIPLPSPAFQAWSENHQAANQPPEIIYALGLPPSQRELPLTFTSSEAALTFPDSGSLADVTLQYSPDLRTWTDLQSFPSGSTGIQKLALPENSTAFLRIILP